MSGWGGGAKWRDEVNKVRREKMVFNRRIFSRVTFMRFSMMSIGLVTCPRGYFLSKMGLKI